VRHDCTGFDSELVWDALVLDIPTLRGTLDAIAKMSGRRSEP
jgi:hypothetical protein